MSIINKYQAVIKGNDYEHALRELLKDSGYIILHTKSITVKNGERTVNVFELKTPPETIVSFIIEDLLKRIN